MERHISIIVPNHNGSATIGTCLEAVFASRYPSFDVTVVDDASTDCSAAVIGRYPCTFLRLPARSGASAARNAGAQASVGEFLFFIDSDCVLTEDTLFAVNRAIDTAGDGPVIIGGTYTPIPYDDSFFSAFQSIFIHYSETKTETPDYIAAHALVIRADLFRQSGGFPEDFLPIIEDVEFSHRLRRAGVALRIDRAILVRHIFNFSICRSLRNAFRKSLFWTIYSLQNRDLFSDSGTASRELKLTVAASFLSLLSAAAAFLLRDCRWLLAAPLLTGLNLLRSRGLAKAFYRAKGPLFTAGAVIYYVTLFPFAVGLGALAGVMRSLRGETELKGGG